MENKWNCFSRISIYFLAVFLALIVLFFCIKDHILPSIIEINIPCICEPLLSLYDRKAVVRQTLLLIKDPKIMEKEQFRVMMEKPQTLLPFIELLEDKREDEEIRSLSASYLGFHLKNKTNDRAEHLLIKSLRDEEVDVRISAASSLGEINSQKAVQEMITLLKEEHNPKVIRTIIWKLGNLGDKRAFLSIASHSDNPNTEVRIEVACALGKIGGEKALTHILPLLKDKDLEVREKALLGISYLGDKKAIKPLKELENDKEIGEEVRKLIEELEKKDKGLQ